MNRPRTSIVVRTLDEARGIAPLLDAIAAQRHAGGVEVVVVDSGSTDGTVAIARDAGARVVPIRREQFSFGRALNVGCEAAKGDHLVFVSGHCRPTSTLWLDRLLRPLHHGGSYAWGRQVGVVDSRFSEHQVLARHFPPTATGDVTHVNNANAAITRDVWRRHRFDEEAPGREDLLMALAVIDGGGQVAYVPDACVTHHHHEGWAATRRRYQREAEVTVALELADRVRPWRTAAHGLVDDARAAARSRRPGVAGDAVAFRLARLAGERRALRGSARPGGSTARRRSWALAT